MQQLDRPSRSPDANPIENVWAFIQNKLPCKNHGRPSSLWGISLKSECHCNFSRKHAKKMPIDYRKRQGLDSILI